MVSTLRDRLRADTRAAHDALDRGFERFDLATREGLGGFLAAHGAALGALRSTPGKGSEQAEALRRDAVAAVEGDLQSLGRQAGPAVAGPGLHPSAVLYVLLGSRLGLRVLERRWAASVDPRVAGAGRLFGLAGRVAEWRRFCEEAGAESGEGPEADRVVADAERAFGLYLAALRDAGSGPEPEAALRS